MVKATRKCSIDDCTTPVGPNGAKGLCPKHYYRVKTYGDPQKSQRIRAKTPEHSFQIRTKWQGDCLIWTGKTHGKGYGVIHGDGKSTSAHRYAWERINGSIPEGQIIDHICFNKVCVNVEHLRLVTYAENNTHFQKPRSDNSSGYRGVSWEKRFNKYRGRVQKNGVEIHVGLFDDPKEAAIATALKRKELGFLLSQYDRDLIAQHQS